MANQLSCNADNSKLNVSRDLLGLLNNKLLTAKDGNKNTVEQFESFSNVLLILLRNIFDENEEFSNRNLIETIVQESKSSFDKGTNVPSNGKTLEQLHSLTDIRLKDSQSLFENVPNDTENKQGKRKRKTKYSDISGDTSHIHREPKRKRRKNQIEETAYDYKNVVNYSGSNGSRQQTTKDESEEKRENILLVRKLMKLLFHPETKYHQDCALAVLRSDEKLMKLFLKEKETFGKQIIPVFRKRTSHSEGTCASPTQIMGDTSQDKFSGDSFSYMQMCETDVSKDGGFISENSSPLTLHSCQDVRYMESNILDRTNLFLPYYSEERMRANEMIYSENMDARIENNSNYIHQNFSQQIRPCTFDVATESTFIQETFFHEYF